MEHEKGYHVGIILDGNGRWAKAQGKPRLFGHLAGEKNVGNIVRACGENNVTVVTLYAFAIANWQRDQEEVDGLWDIFRKFFKKEMEEFMKMGAQVRAIGDRAGLPKDIVEMIKEGEAESKDNVNLIVQFALNYDGVDEVTRAIKKIVTAVQGGELDPKDITDSFVASQLDTGDIQAPDVIIRTGMSQVDNERGMAIWRSSSFLQLQSAQAVCVSTPVLWPDFSPEDLKAAIEFADPDSRLFGGQRKEK